MRKEGVHRRIVILCVQTNFPITNRQSNSQTRGIASIWSPGSRREVSHLVRGWRYRRRSSSISWVKTSASQKILCLRQVGQQFYAPALLPSDAASLSKPNKRGIGVIPQGMHYELSCWAIFWQSLGQCCLHWTLRGSDSAFSLASGFNWQGTSLQYLFRYRLPAIGLGQTSFTSSLLWRRHFYNRFILKKLFIERVLL